MKIDGRKLSRKRRQEIRIEAITRVHAGETPRGVAHSMGLHTGRVFCWMAAFREGGWDALLGHKSSGRPKTLTGPQIKWIYDAITLKEPLQLQLPFALWTRAQIRVIIFRKFHIKLSLKSIGRLLALLGLTVQPPFFRARQQDMEFVERGLTEEHPNSGKGSKNRDFLQG